MYYRLEEKPPVEDKTLFDGLSVYRLSLVAKNANVPLALKSRGYLYRIRKGLKISEEAYTTLKNLIEQNREYLTIKDIHS